MMIYSSLMKDCIEYERPNTVSGLVAKHAELSVLRDRYKTEIKHLVDDLHHVAAVIRLFDPTMTAYPLKGSVTKPRIKRGALKKFVLDTLRETGQPHTSRDLTMGRGKDQGINVTDEIYPDLRRKVSACIKDCVKQGLLVEQGKATHPSHLGSYKLWALKKGDR
ncbi:MAG: hypothetical protein V3V13_04740 [Paracoccaceae bacterium]